MIIRFKPFPNAYFGEDAKIDCIGIPIRHGDTTIGHVLDYVIHTDGSLELIAEVSNGGLEVGWSPGPIVENRTDASPGGGSAIPGPR